MLESHNKLTRYVNSVNKPIATVQVTLHSEEDSCKFNNQTGGDQEKLFKTKVDTSPLSLRDLSVRSASQNSPYPQTSPSILSI